MSMYTSSVTHRDYWQFVDYQGKTVHICLNDISAFGISEYGGSYIVAGGYLHNLQNTLEDIMAAFSANAESIKQNLLSGTP